MPRESLVAIADRVIPFPVAARWAGVDAGGRAKVHCPFGFEHDDGGREQALRVYADHGYCVDEETEILSRTGWIKPPYLDEGSLVLTYRDGATRWEPVQEVIRLPAALRRMLSMETKTHSSLTTVDHRWLVRRGSAANAREVFTTSGEGFRPEDHIPLIGGSCASLPETPRYSDAFVELVAWFFTEGSIWRTSAGRHGVTIHQSHRVNPQYCARIREALRACFGEPSDTIRKTHGWREAVREPKGMTEFILSVRQSAELLKAAPGKVVPVRFITALTREQLVLFTETALDADGARVGTWRQLCQKNPLMLDAFQVAFMLLGTPARVWQRNSGDWACQVHNGRSMQPSRNPGKVRWVDHEGPVWCVRTPSGTWVARRHGTVYVTGNCFAEQRFFTVTMLLAAVWEVTRDDAATEALRRYGWKPASYAHLWEGVMQPREPDRDALRAALAIWCSAHCADWDTRQYDDVAAGRLAQCYGLLPLVRTEQECEDWLRACKQAMAPYLS